MLVVLLSLLLLCGGIGATNNNNVDEWSDVCRGDSWCSRWLAQSNSQLDAWVAQIPTTTSLQTREQRLLALHEVMQPRIITNNCPGVGERLVYNAQTRSALCACNFAHGCPTFNDAAANNVVNIGQAVNSSGATVVLTSLVFVLVILLAVRTVYTTSTTPRFVEIVDV